MAKSSNNKNSKFDQSGENPLYYSDDADFVRELIRELIRRKRYVNRPSKHHLKHRGVNYFYTTGVITIDGQGRHYETGEEAFLKLLDARYPKGPRRFAPAIDPFADLTLSEKLRTAPIFEVTLDDVDDLCHGTDHEQDGRDDLAL
jgi:hypothetical protein